MFNLSKYAGPHRIKDRMIKWEESYQKRSKKLKERFENQLGYGSYRRWEGHDSTTDGDYFIVVGPAKTKELKKRFFVGIKRYPEGEKKHGEEFAPYGEYYSTLFGALSHAAEKWGVPWPKGQHNITKEDLEPVDIPRHVRG